MSTFRFTPPADLALKKHLVCCGVPVHYIARPARSGSTGAFTILCLHNGGTDHRIWSPVAERLSTHYRVVQLDWPGYGVDRSTPKGFASSDYVALLKDFIEQAGLSDVVLVGNCLGSLVALDYARQVKGQGIRALVLFNVLVPSTLGPDSRLLYRLAVSRLRGLFHAVLVRLSVPAALRERVVAHQLKYPQKVDVATRTELAALYADPANIQHLGMLVEALHTSAHLDHCSLPPDFPPTMVLWGGSNRVLPWKAGERFVARLKPTNSYVLDGGHLVMLEQPDICAEHILSFVQSCSDPQSQ